MLILLPPSEGKASPKRGKPLDLVDLSAPELAGPREEMLAALVALCTSHTDPAGVLGIGSTQHDEIDRNAALRTAPTARADRIYTGVLYEALGLETLDAAAKRRASGRVAIMSSLFGVVRPGDRIPAYRLAGNVTLPGVGGVAAFWSRALGPTMEEAAGRGLVVDLRSSTYAGFWRPSPGLASRTVTLRVLHEQGGVRKVVSHFNKATKGRLLRALLEDGGAPSKPAGFATQLRDLGWTVEEGPKPGSLDVVVAEL